MTKIWMRRIWFAAASAALALAVAGCGGSDSHSVTTTTTGSLAGLVYEPPDHSLYVDQDVNPRLVWPSGWAPPTQFTVSLQRVGNDSDLSAVRTKFSQVGEANIFELRPVFRLAAQTVYFIMVEAGVERDIGMFLTRGDPATNSVRRESTNEGAFKHTVILPPR